MPETLLTVVRVLLLLGVANGTPIFAKKLFGSRFDTPLDGGLKFFDGQPLLGTSKTLRGLVLSLACTTLAAPLLGFDWVIGAGLAAASMLGDLLSSFIKRRLAKPVHSQAPALDQIPESLLPLLLLRGQLALSGAEIMIILLLFVTLEVVLSRLLFRLHIREQPY
jgi:hypothetical protein